MIAWRPIKMDWQAVTCHSIGPLDPLDVNNKFPNDGH